MTYNTKGRRPRIEDFYQNYNFHLFDISTTTGLSINSALTTLSPQFGFSSIDVPPLTLEHEEIDPMNRQHKYKVVKGGVVDTFTMARGVKVGNQDFYEWTKRAQFGRGGSVRKRLLVVQLHTQYFTDNVINKIGQFAKGITANFSGQAGRQLGSLAGGQLGAQAIGATAGQVAASESARQLGNHNWANRMWILDGCIPEEYNPADTLEASDSDVTVMELTVAPEQMEEYDFDPRGPLTRNNPN